MTGYGPLARWYDSLTEDVDYGDLYAYLMALLEKNGLSMPESVLDMACGTGSLACIFARAGIPEVYGMDLSEEMLTMAADKAAAMEKPPLFLHGDMSDFSLPEPVDLLTCMLDSFNYLTDPTDGERAIRCFADAVRPGGMLIFDIRPPRQLREFDGQIFMDENDDVVCIWRTEFDEEELLCYYGMDLFIRQGELWERRQEEHIEYAYEPEDIKAMLLAAGFTDVCLYGDRSMLPPSVDEERIFITAKRGNNHV